MTKPATLAHQFFAAATKTPKHTLVCLHGWGFARDCWLPLVEQLRRQCDIYTVDLPGFGESGSLCADSPAQWCEMTLAALSHFIEQLHTPVWLLGWSLGGQLALQLAQQSRQQSGQVLGVVGIATNLRFCASPEWPQAMESEVYEQFVSGFESAPSETYTRFTSLVGASGDAHLRRQLRTLRAEDTIVANSDWRQALRLLAQFDDRDHNINLAQAFVFAECDQLVPVAVTNDVKKILPNAKQLVVEGASHACLLSHPQIIATFVLQFMSDIENSAAPMRDSSATMQRDKKAVADSFSRAADSYDGVAQLQRDIGSKLLEMLPDGEAKTVLDLGSGTGFFTEKLGQLYPAANVIGVDIAKGMLQHARSHRSPACLWLGADMESLPLSENSVDCVFSSLAVQWSENLPQLFAEVWRCLSPNGFFVLATLGPQTLHELRSAWAAADSFTHVNSFTALAEVEAATNLAGFSVFRKTVEQWQLFYPELRQLTFELKALGAHNVNRRRASGLTGTEKVKKLRAAYESYRLPQGLPASYEIYWLVLQKSDSTL